MYNLLIGQYFIIDFDSTFVTVEALEELANIALTNNPQKKAIANKIKEITDMTMDGKITFEESLRKRLALFQPNKKHINQLITLLQQHITPSFLRNKEFFQTYGDNIYTLSGGFRDFIVPVVAQFGIDQSHVLANTFTFDNKGNVTGYDTKNPLAGKGGKTEVIKKLGLVGDIYIIGDGYTDYLVRKNGVVKRFFAFTENINRPVVANLADDVLFSFDELLYMFNFPRTFSYPKNRIHVLLLEQTNQKAVELFSEEGYAVESFAYPLSEKELLQKMEHISILGLGSLTKITKNSIDASKKLLAVGRFGLGTSNIDAHYLAQKGVVLFNDPQSNIRSVAELVLGEIILLSRRAFEKSMQMHTGIWDKSLQSSHEIRGKKLGIIGYDAVGSQLSVLAEMLGMEVYFYDTHDKLPFGNAKFCATLDDLLRIADVITLHVDPNPENNTLITEREFQRMKHGAILLNLSRGLVIDEKLLAKYIKNGTIAGAAIDVFAQEPKKNNVSFRSMLQKLPNVILTPHIGGSTQEAQEKSGQFVTERIIDFINTGNTTQSVNFPNIQLPKLVNAHRLIHMHKNTPGILANINSVLAKHKINIEGQYLQTNAHIGYVITDITKEYGKDVLEELKKMPGTIRLRVLY